METSGVSKDGSVGGAKLVVTQHIEDLD